MEMYIIGGRLTRGDVNSVVGEDGHGAEAADNAQPHNATDGDELAAERGLHGRPLYADQ